ncbi:hypothetical protein JOM56_015205 [Amanita muscaria]
MYFHNYIQSPSPDVPIPPTPHSQSAPSPTSLIMGTHDYRNNRDMHPFSPVAPVGSPFPFPYTYVRRQANTPHSANNNNANANGAGAGGGGGAGAGGAPTKQCAMSGSTISPASTP